MSDNMAYTSLPADHRSPTSFLRLRDVMGRTGLKRSTVFLRVKQGLLPPSLRNGERVAVWPEAEIETINRARIAGKSDDEIRIMVASLKQLRSAAA